MPGIEINPLGELFEGLEHWICCWTNDDLAAMNIVSQYVVIDAFVERWPDA